VTFAETATPEAGGLRRSTRRRTGGAPAATVEETPAAVEGSGSGSGDDDSISDPNFRDVPQGSDDDDDDDDGGQS
jgi:hypothetical protein